VKYAIASVLPLLLAAALAGITPFPSGSAQARDPEKLTILGPNYPRVFFFRASEGAARRKQTGFEEWDAEFSRLMGIMGKCLDEEVLGLDARNPEFFSRFKARHPQQAVLLHFNGNARDPRYHTEPYFPGHWVYRKAARIVADVPAEPGESTIRIDDARDFRVGTGRYRTSSDDIALFGMTADGRHDWGHCEQVQLVSVDAKANTIVVRRGCYGTRPLEFKAGRSRAAAHAVEGPWGKNNHLMWFYNYSTHCPRDPQGRTCSELLVDDLAGWFGPGGKLAAFDGLEFDVLFNQTHGDTDGDGQADDGVVDGVNAYGIGVIEFAEKLRRRMGDAFLIQADGALGPGGSRSQRTWGFSNGIESEGWPNLRDWEFDDWSGGLNRHNFWQANARRPAFSYINHKWIEPLPGKPSVTTHPQVPFSRHRLVFAAAQFTDAMICYSYPPPPGAEGRIGIWDEFCRGADAQLGWLGRPEGPAVHLAAKAADLLAGEDLARRLRGAVDVRTQSGQVTIAADRDAAGDTCFSIPGIAVPGSDLLVVASMRGQPRAGYPATVARFAQVELSGGKINLLRGEPDATGMSLRGQGESPIDSNTGARVTRRREEIGARTLDAYAVHPPYQGATGYVFWCRDVDVPEQAELQFSLGMGPKSPERSDGVWFQVWAAELAGGEPGPFARLFERSTKAHQWIACRVPLGEYAGKRLRLKFVADCGPHNNPTTDHGLWGDVKLAAPGQSDSTDTPPQESMTWVNDRTFESTFYFRGIKSPKVDLAFRIEGPEPMTIERIAAYAGADAMYRVFDSGLVLANPGLAPCTFDLNAISPGRSYVRIRATPGQDAAANNGEPVGGRVTLEPRDALFLIRR